ncbi:MAG: replication-associated recombination protein A [Myxococcaceae bacterium]
MDLFTHADAEAAESQAPLAERMRPKSLDEFAGQAHLTGPGHFLQRIVESKRLPSLILWGPPGTGKTTLAKLLAEGVGATFRPVSAVLSGVKELREEISGAQERARMYGQRTVLFVDEIHRFNKGQQDALLPHVERGTVTLIGATTENPSFEVNAALLSRARVVTLNALEDVALVGLLERALQSDRGLRGKCETDSDALSAIARAASGDARRALTTLETAANISQGRITLDTVKEALQHKTLLYDKDGEQHHNVVSAFIKSMRGSDADAALYWMARMLEAGEDTRFVLRRMVIFASEDIGNADPRALQVAVSALHAFELMGLPEGSLPLTQAVTYLSLAPKSNAVIEAWGRAKQAVAEHGALPVPLHLRNAPTSLMQRLGYGKDYKYPHEFPGHHVDERYLPEALIGLSLYRPSTQGEEKSLAERAAALRAQKSKPIPRE